MGNEHSRRRPYDDDDTITLGDKSYATYRTRDTPVSAMLDAICGGNAYFDDDDDDDDDDKRRKKRKGRKSRSGRGGRSESDDESSEDGTYDESPRSRSDRRSSKRSSRNNRNSNRRTEEDSDADTKGIRSPGESSHDSDNFGKDTLPSMDSHATDDSHLIALGKQPLASSFAKRCYFTKAGIGKTTQHYEGLTLTGNTILMLASAMKLKGCPTICDEDLKRVEASFPNQFSRLPDELLLSSGWRRVAIYCHFSGKPIPDGVPFFHSKERMHPQTGGHYFLLASSIGMVLPQHVAPLDMDHLVLLQTDYPNACDAAPVALVEDPNQWTCVDKFCFFSGGPINTDVDVYYEAEFDGNSIYMLAFLSPSLTPHELYRLNDITGENALKSVAAVEEIDSVYTLTERDFDDLNTFHLGPCRALPSFIVSPEAWKQVLPNIFLECRDKALARAYEYEAHAQEAIAAAGKMSLAASVQSMSVGDRTMQQQQQQQHPQHPQQSMMAMQQLPTQPQAPGGPLVGQMSQNQNISLPLSVNDSGYVGFGDEPHQNQQVDPYQVPSGNGSMPISATESEPFTIERSGSESEEPNDHVGHGDTYGSEDEFPVFDPNLSANGFSRSPDRPFGEESTGLPEYNTTFNSPDRRPDPSGRQASPYRTRMDPPDENSYLSPSPGSSPRRRLDTSQNVSRYESPVSSPHRMSDHDEIMSSSPKSTAGSNRSYQSPIRNGEEEEEEEEEEKSHIIESIDDDSIDESAPTIPISIDDSGRDTSVASSQGSSTRHSSIVSSILQKEFAESPQHEYNSPMHQDSPIDISVDGTDEDNSKDHDSFQEDSPNENETKLALLSPESTVTDGSADSRSTYSRSKVMTGAQQILKKNREQRLALMAKRRETQRHRTVKSPLEEDESLSGSVHVPPPPPPPPAGPRTPSRRSRSRSRARAQNSSRSPNTVDSPPYSPASTRSGRSHRIDSPPPPPLSPRSPGTAYDSNYETASNASMASSGWTEDSDPNDRNSRRALILQMAKNRMKSGSKVDE